MPDVYVVRLSFNHNSNNKRSLIAYGHKAGLCFGSHGWRALEPIGVAQGEVMGVWIIHKQSGIAIQAREQWDWRITSSRSGGHGGTKGFAMMLAHQ